MGLGLGIGLGLGLGLELGLRCRPLLGGERRGGRRRQRLEQARPLVVERPQAETEELVLPPAQHEERLGRRRAGGGWRGPTIALVRSLGVLLLQPRAEERRHQAGAALLECHARGPRQMLREESVAHGATHTLAAAH